MTHAMTIRAFMTPVYRLRAGIVNGGGTRRGQWW
jgi:hypothetical protein